MRFLPEFRDRLIAADPGLTRLLMAARSVFAVGAALGVLLVLAHAFRLPVTVPLLGAALGMTWSIAVNDPTPGKQRATTLLLWIPAAVALTVGTETASNRYLGDGLFVVTLFFSVYVRKYGPRGYAAGMIGVLAFFFALFLRAAPSQLPWFLAALGVTTLCTYVSRFAIFRDRPELALPNAVAAFRARQRCIQRVIDEAAAAACWSGRRKRRLNHHIFRLNEAALAIDDILRGADDPEPRVRVLEAELAANETAERAREHPQSAPRIELLDLGDLRVSSAGEWVPRGTFRVGTAPEMRLPPTLRQAIQLSAAAIPAIIIGEMLSAQRWYWAVLAAWVVFSGTSSSGETLSKGWSRVAGTAVGVAGGIVLAYLVRGHNDLAFVLLLVCLFFAVYTIRLSYAVMIFFITMLLSLLYVIMGLFSDQLLVLRLIETAIGSAFGGIAATLLLPIKTRSVLHNVTAEALGRLREAVDAVVARLGGDEQADTLGALRAYDEAFQSVRTQLRPMISAARFGNAEYLQTRLIVLAACGYYLRGLASIAYESPAASPMERLQCERDAIDSEIAALIDAGSGGRPPMQHAAERTPPAGGAALNYLYRIDRAVHRLAKTL